MRKREPSRRSLNGSRVQHHRTLEIDGQTVVISADRMNASVWLQMPTRPRRWGDDSRLFIDFCQGARYIGAIALCAGLTSLGLFAIMILQDAELIPKWLTGIIGFLLFPVGSGLLLLPAWHEFDRANNRYRRHSWLAPLEIQQSTIAGVQLISGIEVIEETAEGDRIHWRTHQLLLIVKDRDLRRELLYSGADGDTIRSVAEQIAKFLDKPLLIHVQ